MKKVKLSFDVSFRDDVYEKLQHMAQCAGWSSAEDYLHAMYKLKFHDPVVDRVGRSRTRTVEVRIRTQNNEDWDSIEPVEKVVRTESGETSEWLIGAHNMAMQVVRMNVVGIAKEARWNWKESLQGHYISLD